MKLEPELDVSQDLVKVPGLMLYSSSKLCKFMVVFICICHNLALRTGLQDVLSHTNDVPNLQNSFSESGAKATQTMYISDPN